MSEVTLDDVRRILIACAGDVETSELHGDISALEFEDLGYDSLALMETAARIEREFGVHIPEEQMTEVKTPQELLDLVNTSLVDAV
ncbi:MAG: acyl carrier protein [Actinomycetota bacterium]|nr:acyl carrier protein [Actinomycetota bacterium]